jgi:CubicO group peptidase (beta-lactamase class C family)
MTPGATRGSYLYSNAGYVIAGTMLEEVTGEQWEDLIHREVFEPLGMTSTGFGPPGSLGAVPDQPRGHVRQGSQWIALEPNANADNPAALGPAGTVHSSLGDYARYVAAHLAGARGTPGLVSAAAFEKLHTPAPGSSYALGWNAQTRNWAGGRTLAHAGSNTLWYAVVWIAPERDFAMIAVTNAGGDDAARGTDLAIQALIERFDALTAASN